MKRENMVSTSGRGGPETFVETILNEAEERVVKSVRKRERRSALALCLAFAGAHVGEKFRRRNGLGRFRESGGEKLAAMIVRTADQNLAPRFGMGRREVVAIGKLIDFITR